jgi:hypothetical protein
MLHAVLHRKLDELTPEPQRLEDALTATVFGMLLAVEAWDLLARWLRLGPLPDAEMEGAHRECWFWPHLALAEPDVVLRLGDILVVVEAKYRSGRHDLKGAGDVDEALGDQLRRQYDCVKNAPGSRARYAAPIERAITECRLVQAYVVDARRRLQTDRELAQSKGRLPQDARVERIFWQSLFELLGSPGFRGKRWAADLRSYLDHLGLDAFEGIGRRVPVLPELRGITRWRARRHGPGFSVVAELVASARVHDLGVWRSSANAMARARLTAMDRRVLDGSSASTLLAWRR